jgi:hypothetical protein
MKGLEPSTFRMARTATDTRTQPENLIPVEAWTTFDDEAISERVFAEVKRAVGVGPLGAN